MHLWALGVVKVLVTFTFTGAAARTHKTKYERQRPERTNQKLARIKACLIDVVGTFATIYSYRCLLSSKTHNPLMPQR